MDILETERLLLYPLTRSFLTEEYLSWINNDEVIRFLETEKGSTIEDLNKYLKSIETNKIFAWAIVLKETDKHIGNIKIDPIDSKHGYGEYGIMIGDKDTWGQGFAKEASKRVLMYCFETLKLRKVNLGVLKNNSSAVKLYESLGFVKEGVYKKHKVYDGVVYDELRMALFK